MESRHKYEIIYNMKIRITREKRNEAKQQLAHLQTGSMYIHSDTCTYDLYDEKGHVQLESKNVSQKSSTHRLKCSEMIVRLEIAYIYS